MASLINISGITINEQEALNANEAVFTKSLMKPELRKVHTIATGIQMKTQIPIYGRFGLIGQKSLGSCNVNLETVEAVATEKFWDPALISTRLYHCQEDIDQLFKMWKLNADALKTWDTMDPGQDEFLVDLTTDALFNAILRITSFGNTSEDVVGSGGNLTAGTDKLYFTMINGLWYQLIAAVTSGTTPRYAINENGAATYATQNALAADRALKVFRNLYESIDTRAFRDGQLVYQVTHSLLLNWQSFLEDKSLAFTLEKAEKGATVYNYRGIPIIPRYDWTNNIKSHFDNGTKLYLPHRVLLGPISNIPIGTSDDGNFTDLKMWYSNDDKKLYTEIAFYIDCKLVEDHMAAVAY